jgi:hypothetical protein
MVVGRAESQFSAAVSFYKDKVCACVCCRARGAVSFYKHKRVHIRPCVCVCVRVHVRFSVHLSLSLSLSHFLSVVCLWVDTCAPAQMCKHGRHVSLVCTHACMQGGWLGELVRRVGKKIDFFSFCGSAHIGRGGRC